jgi:hypothetical protein
MMIETMIHESPPDRPWRFPLATIIPATFRQIKGFKRRRAVPAAILGDRPQ